MWFMAIDWSLTGRIKTTVKKLEGYLVTLEYPGSMAR